MCRKIKKIDKESNKDDKMDRRTDKHIDKNTYGIKIKICSDTAIKRKQR